MGDGEAEFEFVALGGGIGVGSAGEEGSRETIGLCGGGEGGEGSAAQSGPEHGAMDGRCGSEGARAEVVLAMGEGRPGSKLEGRVFEAEKAVNVT
jgi:hypothetical protein